MSMTPGLNQIDPHYQRYGALPPDQSIACLRDKVRTKIFMQGVAEAVSSLDASSPETIEVCDAGTGAIPVLAIYAALSSDKVRCTALELNPQSAALARQAIAHFGLQDRIKVIEADATKYQPQRPLDLLISETMHSGLTGEPIVQILSNLQPHVKSSGITLPSEVNVKASIVPCEDVYNPAEYTKVHKNLQPLVSTEWQEIVTYTPGQPLDIIDFTLDGQDLPDGEYFVAITNDVVVGSRTLKPLRSLITMPQYVRYRTGEPQAFTLASDADKASTISVKYAPGSWLDGADRQQ